MTVENIDYSSKMEKQFLDGIKHSFQNQMPCTYKCFKVIYVFADNINYNINATDFPNC